jgi:hypothetical protein
MKKIILSVILTSIMATVTYAQTSKKTAEISICKTTKNVITLAELEKCNMVVTADDKMKVKSFTISFLVTGDDGKDVYADYKVAGNALTPNILAEIKRMENKIKKVLIEEVIAVDASKNEKKLQGMIFTLR